MWPRIKLIASDSFFRNNFIFFSGSMIVAAFNYLYHPVLGRIMDLRGFGEVQTLFSLFAQMAIVGGIFRIIVINIVANSEDKEQAEKAVSMLYKFALGLMLAISALVVALSPFLKNFFHFTSNYPFFALAVILITGVPLSFREAILQGKKNFKSVSISQIIQSLGKLIFAVILVTAGFSSFGAISAIIIAQILAIFYVSSRIKNIFNLKINGTRIDGQIKKELNFGALVFLITLATTFLYTSDIIIVKHYFPADIAGLYSGISIIARIVYFITASIGGVLLSSVKLSDNNGDNFKNLKKSLILILAVSGSALVVFSLFPNIVIGTLLGAKYIGYSYLLPRLSLVLFLVSISNILLLYMMALRDYRAAAISILAIAAAGLFSYFHHGTLIDVINNFLFGVSIVIIFFVAIYLKKLYLNLRAK